MKDQAQDEDEEDEEDVEVLDEFPSPPPPGFADPASYSPEQIDALLVLMRGGTGRKSRLLPMSVSPLL